MWKATAGHNVPQQNNADDDDWETDPDFVNDVTEEEQRWGAKTIEGSGRTAGAIDMTQLRSETEKADADKKKKEIEIKNPGHGYGGKFGIEKDRMDKSAVGHEYIGKVEKHSSQKDYASGFGGKFGIEKDRVDKSAVGWDHIEKVEKHESQKDYSKGFGGKFGVQEDRKDASAAGWDYVEKTEKHGSQVDHKIGFGGKFGVQNVMDKSALTFQENPEKTGTNYTKVKPDIGSAKPSNLRAKFENFAKEKEEEDSKQAAEQKRLREEKDRLDREQALNSQQNGKDSNETEMRQQSRTPIETGRTGSIGNAITMFNKVEPIAPIQRKEPIKIPREPVLPKEPEAEPEPEPKVESTPIPAPVQYAQASAMQEHMANFVSQQPDVIPTQRESVQSETFEALAPPEAFGNQNGANVENIPEIVQDVPNQAIANEQIYSNIDYIQSQQANEIQAQTEEQNNATALAGNEDCDLSEYIEDTKIQAIALYDYAASAEDEISFDPNDIISHIEKIDEGWWRGLCKNRYGLFPANYVQIVE